MNKLKKQSSSRSRKFYKCIYIPINDVKPNNNHLSQNLFKKAAFTEISQNLPQNNVFLKFIVKHINSSLEKDINTYSKCFFFNPLYRNCLHQNRKKILGHQ